MTAPVRLDGAEPARPATSLLEAVQRGWWLIAAVGAIGLAAGLVFSGLQPTRYAATARVLLDERVQPSDLGSLTGEQDVNPQRRLENEVQRMQSPDVIARARELAADVPGVADLRGNLSVSATGTNDLIRATVTSPSAEAAAALANAVVAAYEEVVVEQRTAELTNGIAQLTASRDRLLGELQQVTTGLQTILIETQDQVRRIYVSPSEQTAEVNRRLSADPEHQRLLQQQTALQESLNDANEQLDAANLALSLLGSDVSVAEEAGVPGSPVQPKPLRNAALGLAVGLLGGTGAAWWLADRSRPTDAATAADHLGAPRFATLRRGLGDDDGAHDLGMLSELGNVGRVTAAALLHRIEGRRGETILVTGTRPADGRTLTSLALATALAHTGRSPVLVDADPAGRGLTRACNAEGALGVSDHEMGASVGDVLHRFPMSDVPSLLLVPAGTGEIDPSTLADQRPGALLADLRRNVDVVILDGPNVLESSTAVELAGVASCVLLVVAQDAPVEEIDAVRQRLELLDANLVGFVLNEHPSGTRVPPVVKGMLRLGEVPVAALPAAAGGVRAEPRHERPPDPVRHWGPPPPVKPPDPPEPPEQPGPRQQRPAGPRPDRVTSRPAAPRSSTPLGFTLPARRRQPDPNERG